MTHTITVGRLPKHPLLGRHVNHDSRSLTYGFDTAGLTITPVKWARYIPVLDQGSLGSCTGNAGIGCLGTGAFFDTQPADTDWSETAAVDLYSDATRLDSDPDNYPPVDTGSDGLSIAKVLKSTGRISGYQHTFTTNDALKALSTSPIIIGVNWYNNMFHPDAKGMVTITRGDTIAGGHEFVVDELTADGRVGFTNSWGTSWGLSGRAYMTSATFDRLLAEQGDATIFVPITSPAPGPTPPPKPVLTDAMVLADAVAKWRDRRSPCIGSKSAQRAVDAFLVSQGL